MDVSCHNKNMAYISIYGASTDDRIFFHQQLAGNDLTYYSGPLDRATLEPQTEVLAVFIDSPVTEDVIKSLPNLKLIACRSTGYNHIDLKAAKARGIIIANVPSYGGVAVAEYTFTLLLMMSRRMVEVLRESGVMTDRQRERGFDLAGRTIGIVGTGAIGLSVARIAKGFGMNVLGFDMFPRPEEASKIGFTYEKKVEDLLAKSDVVTLHIPYTPENHHFINRERVGMLRHGAYVVNTARGELIDTAALVKGLRHSHIGAAALDVMESEYLLEPDKLIELASHSDAAKETLAHAVSLAALQHMPNVILTNHNAYNTVEAVQRINQVTADNIRHFLNHEEVFSV
jgi:D-lactate dehydrogenase